MDRRPALPFATERSPVPLYHRLYSILRQQIAAGAFAVGKTLPSEAALTQQFGVSRITAKRALDELAAEGLVARARGRGTVVTSAAGTLGARPIEASIAGLRQNLDAIGRTTTVEVISFEYAPAPPDAAIGLGLTAGEIVQRAVRIRRLDGAAFSQSTSSVPERIGRTFARADLESLPLIDLIERSGVRIGTAEQSIGAILADRTVAVRLEVQPGDPLVRLERRLLDEGGTPVQLIEVLYRADRFAYRMHLSREEAAEQELLLAAVPKAPPRPT